MINLLIVDDEIFTREGIIDGLPWKQMGIDNIIQADDGLTGIQAVQKIKPDIILTDVRMIRMNGIEMSKSIREIYPDCKIIFMSGYSDKEYLLSAIQLKANYYIEKPIKRDELRKVLEEAVKACMEEEYKRIRDMLDQKKLDISIPLVTSKMVLLLLNDDLKTDLINDCINMGILKIQADSFFTTAIIRAVTDLDVSESELNEFLLELNNHIENVFKQRNCNTISAVKDKEYLVVHISCSLDNQNMLNNRNTQALFEELYDVDKKFKLFIAVGKCVRGIERVHESYKAALAAMQKAFFRGFRFVNFYSTESSDINSFNKEIPEEYLTAIAESCKSDSVLSIRKMTSQFRACDSVDSDIIKDVYYKCILLLYKQIEKYGVSSFYKGGDDKNQLWKVLNNLNTLDEVMEFTLQNIEHYYECIDEIKKGNSQNILKIFEYIDKNYMNPDLGVSDISSNTFLSPAYMCTHFKQVTGKTINQYVTEYRIDKAKVLLADKEYRISEVARLVGYDDSNYFARLFKKSLGLLPSEFRDRMG